jgi:glycosyltransferase involved in cell wall biosynthesis
MKNIVHLIASNFYGGPEKQIVEHLLRINKTNKYNGILISFLEKNLKNEIIEIAHNLHIENYGIKMMNAIDIRAQFDLIKLLKSLNIDLLITHGYKSAVMGWAAARYLQKKVIAYSRGYTSEDKKVAFYEWLERRFLNKTDGIIAVSEGQKRKLKKLKVENRNIWVVHNAINSEIKQSIMDSKNRDEILNKFNIPQNSTIIVTAGRFSPEKGHKFLINAIKHIFDKINNTYFIFCGDGICEEELKLQAEKNGILNVCRFVGFRKDLADIFKVMDIFVLPSLTEGLPNVILESFASAKPVISTSVGGVPEIIDDGVNGILVPAENSELLGDKMYELINSPILREEYGKKGLETVKLKFTFEEQTTKLMQIYSSIYGSKN